MKIIWLSLLITTVFAGCNRLAPENLVAADFQSYALESKKFTLHSKIKSASKHKKLKVYIEGDGHSVSRGEPSDDPTPRQALALALAIQDPHPKVAYLARPCQYHFTKACRKEIWSSHRFSEAVITAMHGALDQLKVITNTQELELIGFSGGASIALLTAKDRKDVIGLRTISGDVNHVAMTAYHGTVPMHASLNPQDYIEQLRTIPQWHFVGDSDSTVPSTIVEQFTNAQNSPCVQSQVLPRHGHHSPWLRTWPKLRDIPFRTSSL